MSAKSEIITLIVSRLNGHKATGKKISGAKVFDYPEEAAQGESDYPIVRVWVPTFTEAFVRSRPADVSLTLNLSVGTKREAGVAAHSAFVDGVLDALEVDDATDLVDLQLGDTIRQPFAASVSVGAVTQIGLFSEISVTVIPKKTIKRGSRT